MNRASKICTVTRIGRLWDAILVTEDGFGALMCKKVCAVTQTRLGEGVGGGDTIGGGVGEPRTTTVLYIYIYLSLDISIYLHICTSSIIYPETPFYLARLQNPEHLFRKVGFLWRVWMAGCGIS